MLQTLLSLVPLIIILGLLLVRVNMLAAGLVGGILAMLIGRITMTQWHDGELCPRIGFIVTNSKLPAGKVVKVYNGRGDVENRINEGKNTLRWDKTSCHRFAANQARLLMGVLAYNLLHMLRQFYLIGEQAKRSMEWLSKRLIKVGGKIAYHGRRWYVHVASAFLLAGHHRRVFG